MIIDYEITGVEESVGRLMSLTDLLRAGLTNEMEHQMADLSRYVVDSKLNGQYLQRQTGQLANKVTAGVDSPSDGPIVGRVYVDGVAYARILELGGHTAPHQIIPTAALALRFPWNDGFRFASRVNHPGSKIPEFSYLRDSLQDLSAQIISGLEDAVERSLP